MVQFEPCYFLKKVAKFYVYFRYFPRSIRMKCFMEYHKITKKVTALIVEVAK